MSVEEQAIGILDRMRKIVKNEQLIKGSYITEEVVDKKLARKGAICGGHQACAVGALWLAGDAPKEIWADSSGNVFVVDLEGVDSVHRAEFLGREGNEALALAYDAINEATEQYVAKHGLEETLDPDYNASVESFFEGSIDLDEIYPHMKKIIKRAKRNLRERD